MILAWFLYFGEVFVVWILSSLFAVAMRSLAGTNIAGKSFLRETKIIVMIIVFFWTPRVSHILAQLRDVAV